MARETKSTEENEAVTYMQRSERNVYDLIKKAKDAKQCTEAMQYSQAACNAASALEKVRNL